MAVEVEAHREPLVAVRRVLDDADEAVLAVAFVQQRGVNLLERQLARLAYGRMVTTTVFASTTMQGLEGAQRQGLRVRVLNPPRGTFHPKLYVARHGDRLAAALGSANLTSGLVANIEAVALLHGPAAEPALRDLWELAESLWGHPAALDWTPAVAPAPAEVLDTDLLARLRAAMPGPVQIATLGDDPRPNWISEITPDGVWVETERSRALGRPAQLVDAWMIQVAWDWLVAHGSLTNRHLLATEGLNVKRSSFVCALLAVLPEVDVRSRRPIELALTQSVARASTA
jgi:hypothetical protein